MSASSPLDHPRLQAVAQELDVGNLDAAQRLLAEIGNLEGLGHGITFLATRLLFLRGRLDPDGVVVRLQDLVRGAGSFPEAEVMLALAESGRLRRSVLPPASQPPSSPVNDNPTPVVPNRSGSDAPKIANRGAFRPGRQFGPDTRDSQAPETLDAAEIESLPPAKAASGPPKPVMVDSLEPPRLPPEFMPQVEVIPASKPASTPAARGGETDERTSEQPRGEPTHRPSPLRLTFHELADSDPAPAPVAEQPGPAPAVERSLGKLDALIAIDELWNEPPTAAGAARARVRPAMAPDRSPREESDRGFLAIPPAPAVPRITPPPDPTPSYVPPETRRAATKAKTEGERPRLSERVRDEIVADSRYSVQPDAEEVVWQPSSGAESSSPSSVPAPSTPAPEKPSSHPVGKIRSGRPPASNDSAPPTLFEVASLLDQGLFGQALEALGDDDSGHPPDHVLMRARALVGAGRRADALAALDRLVARSELDSDHRAASARLLVELGELEQALEQARLSSTEAPDSALTRLTHAWAAVRLARRTGMNELVAEAERMLAGLKSRGSPHPALLYALRACVHAQQGDPERAIGIAQRALALVPEFPDALAAIALGSARLGRTLDAQRASLRLVDVAHEEAAALTLLFERMGLRLGQEPAQASEGQPRAYWDALEVAWLDGRFEEVAVAFERTCRRRLSELAEGVEEPSFAVIGGAGATTLTTSPVWLNFAPYDFSFFSLERVAKALDLLYEHLPQPRPDADDFPVQVVLGSYLGETLCRIHAARWEGTVADLERVRVVARDAAWYPFVTLGSRLRGAGTLEFGGLDRSRLLHPGAETRTQEMPLPVAPPCPWDPSPWPNPVDIPALGTALMRSVISSYCARHAGGPLDGTISSLVPLEGYLHLVAPGKARIEPPPPWAPRVATLCGAYLGEVLRRNLDGRWLVPHDGTLGPDSYRLRVGGTETAPVATVLAHLTGRSATPLHEHAARLMARGR